MPLSLLVVGSLLAGMSAGQVLRSPKLWLLTAIRLLLLPVALCLVLRALGIDSLVLGIAVTQMAMPVAVDVYKRQWWCPPAHRRAPLRRAHRPPDGGRLPPSCRFGG